MNDNIKILLVCLAIIIAMVIYSAIKAPTKPEPCPCECFELGESVIFQDVDYLNASDTLWFTDDEGKDYSVYEFDPSVNWGKYINKQGDTIEIKFDHYE